MKLLIDQNLSDRLAVRLARTFPGSTHVKALDLETSDDQELWVRCRRDRYVLLTKDRDFEDERRLAGPPPKAILLLVGNPSTSRVEVLLASRAGAIAAFETSNERVLILS